jgi:hypothetical protein
VVHRRTRLRALIDPGFAKSIPKFSAVSITSVTLSDSPSRFRDKTRSKSRSETPLARVDFRSLKRPWMVMQVEEGFQERTMFWKALVLTAFAFIMALSTSHALTVEEISLLKKRA